MTLSDLLRDLAPRVLATLLRRQRDFAAAEDAVQEALLAAARQWPREGVPDNPRAWLTQVATRRLLDEIRSNAARRQRETEAAGYLMPSASAPSEEDDTLQLMRMCCHPALSRSSAVALTLRAVGGLTTAEIARAFLVPEATMAQRISRAKQTIQASDPSAFGTDPRAVLHVLYLIFNEGYTASSGPSLVRDDLASEAIRLTRLLAAQLPDDPEAAGLLALMLLTDARRHARTGPLGEPIPLDEQDRTRWDRQQIDEGNAILNQAFARGAVGPYQLQAAIAALHDEARDAASTDWRQILALYDVLLRITPGPIVALNRAVAAAMVHGPAHALDLLNQLERDLPAHHRLPAVRAHLLERLGDLAAAAQHYRKAATLTSSLPERNYLLTRAARLDAGAPPTPPAATSPAAPTTTAPASRS